MIVQKIVFDQVSIVTAHPLAAEFITMILNSCLNSPEIEYVSEVGGLRFGNLRTEANRLCILDCYSFTNEVDVVNRTMASLRAQTKCLALVPAVSITSHKLVGLISSGTEGIVDLGCRVEEDLPLAVDALSRSIVWVSKTLVPRIMEELKNISSDIARTKLSLTAREQQVYLFLRRRLSNKEIACELGIAERTVKFHVSNILNKLRSKTRKQAIESLGRE